MRLDSQEIPNQAFRSAGGRWEDGVFVRWVEAVAGRPVVDRTDLSGQFDITLEYNPDIRRIPELPGSGTL